MSNPFRAPLNQIYVTSRQKVLASAPDAYFKWQSAGLEQAFREKLGHAKRPEFIVGQLRDLDVTLVSSFVLPKNLTVDARVQNSVHQVLAFAPADKLQARNRSQEGKGGAVVLFSGLPETPIERYMGRFPGYIPTRAEVAASMEDKFFMYGGAQNALGRLVTAFPRRKMKGLSPASVFQTRAALRGSGALVSEYGYPDSYFTPYPMVAPENGGVSISINHNSDNGFPVLGKWNTPGAAAQVLQLAASLREDLSKAPDVVARVRELEKSAPHLVTLMGKAKADYYSQAKVEGLMLRFYNVVPRQLMLIIQTATQPYEHLCRKLGEDPDVRTAVGTTLVHQGGGRLVDALQRQLDAQSEKAVQTAYLHVGDDSWVVVYLKGARLMFMCDLDCSNFDLTQHAAVTKPVHDAIRDQLRLFDKVAADLWYALVRERQVVVATTVVAKFPHGGPSGMPLQSKVNDILMEILLAAYTARLRNLNVQELNSWDTLPRPWPEPVCQVGVPCRTPDDFMLTMRRIAEQEARNMGFSLKLENLSYLHFPQRSSGMTSPLEQASRPLAEEGTLLGLPPHVLHEILTRAARVSGDVRESMRLPQVDPLAAGREMFELYRKKYTRDSLRLVSKDMKAQVDSVVPSPVRPTVKEFLRRRPFKFIGYYFQVVDDMVQVYCDLPRMMAQLPYPSLKWVMNGSAFAAAEAMRVGSIFCSMGYPGPAMRATHESFRAYALGLVDAAIKKFGDQEDPRLRWATQASPYGGPEQASLSGLRAAILKADALWADPPEKPMPSESVLLPLDVSVSALWADQVEEEEKVQAGGRVMRPEGQLLRPPPPRRLQTTPVPTHPATERNAGRPPPTAVWAPDKPRRERAETSAAAAARPRGKGKRAGVARGEEYEYEDAQSVNSEEYTGYAYEAGDSAAYAYYGHDDDDREDFGGYSRRRY